MQLVMQRSRGGAYVKNIRMGKDLWIEIMNDDNNTDTIIRWSIQKTKDGFEEAFSKAMEMLKTWDQRYAKYESSLREFGNMKDSYA